MDNETKTHLIADPTLGGLKREYIETGSFADYGDFVVPSFDKSHGYFTDNKLYEVIDADRNGEVTLIDDNGDEHILSFVNYKNVEPTDIVVVPEEYKDYSAEKRYRLVDRKARVGEKVLYYYEGKSDVPVQTVTEVTDELVEFENYKVDDDEWVNGFCHGAYYVLEPVEAEADISEVTTSQASPEVIEMLANLSQRIVDLERTNKRLLEEVDILHANQKRLGEELANLTVKTTFEADEVIVELAKLLVEASRRESRLEAVR